MVARWLVEGRGWDEVLVAYCAFAAWLAWGARKK
jgi:hypothetical protein